LPPHGTVYVIDDDGAVRDSIRVLLVSVGFYVLDFASALEFLGHSREDGYGCIVTDILMPGMSGLQLIEEVRLRDEVIPIIAMTGRPDPVLRQAVEAADAILLVKPFSPRKLVALVSKALSGRLH
jgi:two-component system, LuxR family, response regulator FixJ